MRRNANPLENDGMGVVVPSSGMKVTSSLFLSTGDKAVEVAELSLHYIFKVEEP